jgi:hypothetical protein
MYSGVGERARRGAISGAVLDLAVAALVAVIRTRGSTPGQRHAEGPWGTLGFVVLVAGPGVLALAGVAVQRAAVVGAAGFACLPIALLSIATLPLAIVGALLLVAFARTPSNAGGRTVVVLAIYLTGTLAAMAMLLNTASYTSLTATGGESGAYIPAAFAGMAVALVVVAAAASVAVATG